MASAKTCVIALQSNGDPPHEGKGLKIPNGCTLRLLVAAGSSINNFAPEIYSNYPVNGKPFERDSFNLLAKRMAEGVVDWNVDIQITASGSYSYYVQYTEANAIKKSVPGQFYVDPVLTLRGKVLPIDAVAIQTVLPKCLGKFEEWEKRLEFSALSGYNMIHFTPIQELGASGSAYSIYHQHKLNSNFFAANTPEAQKDKLLKDLLSTLETKHGLLSVTDMVWNHTANNSPWLADHPEAGYNTENSPHLKSAFAFDEALLNFSKSIVGFEVNNDGDLSNVMDQIQYTVIPEAKLWEFFIFDVPTHVEEFKAAVLAGKKFEPVYGQAFLGNEAAQDILLRDGINLSSSGDRFSNKFKLEVALALFNVPADPNQFEERARHYEHAISNINLKRYQQYDDDIATAIMNMTQRVKYERLAHHGPRMGPVSIRHPILESYFTRVQTSKGQAALANNGWIFNGNPLVDFAGPTSNAYFRREVIVWADCVKLRYGKSPADSPWLWQHMREYSEKMAAAFHGFRIDNCHSTPIHLAQYLLDASRRVRPNLYVVCELFTGSEEIDAMFVSQLGITALIREAMGANDSWELGRLCHRHGGQPVGSLRQGDLVHARPALPGALFTDCTHDNETPAQKRVPEDALPNTAIVAMTISASGSNRGYDELVPKLIDVVHETRQYVKEPSPDVGIRKAKEAINLLHQRLAIEGYCEIHVHQEENTISIQRHNPVTHDAIYLVAHTAFSRHAAPVRPVKVPGLVKKFLFAANLSEISGAKEDPKFIEGLTGKLFYAEGEEAAKTVYVHTDSENTKQEIHFNHFPPGSVIAFQVELPAQSKTALSQLHNLLDDSKELEKALSECTLLDLNVLLYRHSIEELSTTGNKSYSLPNYGDLVYCGLQGFASILAKVATYNDLGHPICGNLRDGDWIMTYITSRLSQRPRLQKIQQWLEKAFSLVQKMPRYLVPKYFHQVFSIAYNAAIRSSVALMSGFVKTGSSFVQALALTSVELYSVVKSGSVMEHDGILPDGADNRASLAAGIPHFASGYMRNWGRDTFISIRGLLLVTGRFDEARLLILAFGATLRHGLIPNLLDSGNRPRFNSRDSVWWYLQAVQDYCLMSPEGNKFLTAPIKRLFVNDTRERGVSTVVDFIHEILTKHAKGISFREWEAGTMIDDRMQDQGFNISIRLDAETGLLHGGNVSNCGTWMDKMGESSKMGNKGKPATPRDGAPVEITGLLKSTLRWIVQLNEKGLFLHKGVDGVITYSEWNSRLQKSFETNYYVPENLTLDSNYKVESKLVNRRGIYKDVVGSDATHPWSDYQLRCNFFVAMAVAPELFDKSHAALALATAEKLLLEGAPLGVRTLDPGDLNYRGDYTNSESDDPLTAGGFNYHNGPEWLWPLGYFLRAKLNFFDKKSGADVDAGHMMHRFLPEHKLLIKNDWAGLPELTNHNGTYCAASCEVQAWSSATLLDALYDLSHQSK